MGSLLQANDVRNYVVGVNCMGGGYRGLNKDQSASEIRWFHYSRMNESTSPLLSCFERSFFGYVYLGLYDSSNPPNSTLFQDPRRVSTCNLIKDTFIFWENVDIIGKKVAPSFTRVSITRLSTWCFWLEARNRCVSWQRTLFVCYDRSGRSALGGDPLWGRGDVPLLRKISWQDVPSKFLFNAGIYYWKEIRGWASMNVNEGKTWWIRFP